MKHNCACWHCYMCYCLPLRVLCPSGCVAAPGLWIRMWPLFQWLWSSAVWRSGEDWGSLTS